MKLKTFVAVCFLILLACFAVACTETPEPSEVVVESVVVKTMPTKTRYGIEDKLDLNGGSIEVSFSDGTKAIIGMNNKNIDVVGFDSSSAAQLDISLVYMEKSVSIPVIVSESASPVESISINKAPLQKIYYTDSTVIEPAGGTLLIHYEDESIEPSITGMTNRRINFDFDFSIADEQSQVTVVYECEDGIFETSFAVNVKESPLQQLGKDIESATIVGYGNDEALFLYFYLRANEAREQIYAEANSEMRAAFENNHGSSFQALQKAYESWFKTKIEANVFEDDDYMNFLDKFLLMSYNYKMFNTIYTRSASFDTDLNEMMQLFELLGDNQIVVLSSVNGRFYEYFYYLNRAYYDKQLYSEELAAYGYLFQASIFHKFFVQTGDRLTDYISCIENCMDAYADIENTQNFDNLFGALYQDMTTFYFDYKGELLYINEIIDFIFGQMSDAFVVVEYFKDFTYLLIYYPTLQNYIDSVTDPNLTPEGLNHDRLHETFLTTKVSGYLITDYLELFEAAYNYAMDMTSAEKSPALNAFFARYMTFSTKWFAAGGMYDRPCDPSLYEGDFENEIKEIATGYWTLSEEDKFALISVTDSTFKGIIDQYYSSLFTKNSDEFNLYSRLYSISLLHIQMICTEDSEDSAWFRREFVRNCRALAIRYDELADKTLFDSHLKTAYDMYIGFYNNLES